VTATVTPGAIEQSSQSHVPSRSQRSFAPQVRPSLGRRDEESGASYALKLTAAGAKAIAVEYGAEPEGAGEKGAGPAGRDQAALPSRHCHI